MEPPPNHRHNRCYLTSHSSRNQMEIFIDQSSQKSIQFGCVFVLSCPRCIYHHDKICRFRPFLVSLSPKQTIWRAFLPPFWVRMYCSLLLFVCTVHILCFYFYLWDEHKKGKHNNSPRSYTNQLSHPPGQSINRKHGCYQCDRPELCTLISKQAQNT